MPKRKKSHTLNWEEAPEIKEKIEHIVQTIDLSYIDSQKISCYRTYGSSSKSYARIWSFPKIFQHALQIQPHYVIEVLAKYYDTLDVDGQTRVLIHELLHIPKNFSGALLPHRTRIRELDTVARKLFKEYKMKLQKNHL